MVTRLYYNNAEKGYFDPPLSGLPVTMENYRRPSNKMIPKLTAARPALLASQIGVGNQLTALVGGGTSIPCFCFATAPLQAQAIAGTVKGQMQAFEDSLSYNLNAEMWIYLIGSDWAYKSTLMGSSAPATNLAEWNVTTLRNQKFPYNGAISLTGQTAVAGDRILVVVGFKGFINTGAVGTAALGQIKWASAAGSDLPEDETTTTDAAPWIEFSQDLNFDTDVYPTIDCEPFTEEGHGVGGGGGAVVPTEGQTWPRVS
jgi:hypothetical protein